MEEEAILRFYTTESGYKNLNIALNGNARVTEDIIAQKSLMNQALSKLPNYKSDDLLYRIEDLSDKEISKIYKEGQDVVKQVFTSSTYSFKALRDAVLVRRYRVIIRIDGKNGKLIEGLSTLKPEKEVLFKSGTVFTVKKVSWTQDPLDWMKLVREITLIEK